MAHLTANPVLYSPCRVCLRVCVFASHEKALDGPKLCLFERYVAYKYQNTRQCACGEERARVRERVGVQSLSCRKGTSPGTHAVCPSDDQDQEEKRPE